MLSLRQTQPLLQYHTSDTERKIAKAIVPQKTLFQRIPLLAKALTVVGYDLKSALTPRFLTVALKQCRKPEYGLCATCSLSSSSEQ